MLRESVQLTKMKPGTIQFQESNARRGVLPSQVDTQEPHMSLDAEASVPL